MYVDAKWPLDPLLTLVRAFTPEPIMLPRNRVGAAAWSLQTVYDLAAKSRVGLRFNCKNLTSKCASLRFTCNRHQRWEAGCRHGRTLFAEIRKHGYVGCYSGLAKFLSPWRQPRAETRRAIST